MFTSKACIAWHGVTLSIAQFFENLIKRQKYTNRKNSQIEVSLKIAKKKEGGRREKKGGAGVGNREQANHSKLGQWH